MPKFKTWQIDKTPYNVYSQLVEVGEGKYKSESKKGSLDKWSRGWIQWNILPTFSSFYTASFCHCLCRFTYCRVTFVQFPCFTTHIAGWITWAPVSIGIFAVYKCWKDMNLWLCIPRWAIIRLLTIPSWPYLHPPHPQQSQS